MVSSLYWQFKKSWIEIIINSPSIFFWTAWLTWKWQRFWSNKKVCGVWVIHLKNWYIPLKLALMEIFSLAKREKYFKLKSFCSTNTCFLRIICSEPFRTLTKETFLSNIFLHSSPMKTFPFGLFLMEQISVYQVNDPNSTYFFL